MNGSLRDNKDFEAILRNYFFMRPEILTKLQNKAALSPLENQVSINYDQVFKFWIFSFRDRDVHSSFLYSTLLFLTNF